MMMMTMIVTVMATMVMMMMTMSCPTPFLVLKVHLNFCSSTHLLVHAPPYCAADDHPGKDEKNVYNGDDDDPLVKKF